MFIPIVVTVSSFLLGMLLGMWVMKPIKLKKRKESISRYFVPKDKYSVIEWWRYKDGELFCKLIVRDEEIRSYYSFEEFNRHMIETNLVEEE